MTAVISCRGIVLVKRADVHGQVDRGVESESALVRAEGRVVLDTESAVDLDVALVVTPGDTELDDALGDGGDGEGGAELGLLREELAVLEGAGELYEKELGTSSH